MASDQPYHILRINAADEGKALPELVSALVTIMMALDMANAEAAPDSHFFNSYGALVSCENMEHYHDVLRKFTPAAEGDIEGHREWVGKVVPASLKVAPCVVPRPIRSRLVGPCIEMFIFLLDAMVDEEAGAPPQQQLSEET